MKKPKPTLSFKLDSPTAPTPFRARSMLSSLKETASFHETHDCRHPMGIYNISINRILRKTISCSKRVEQMQNKILSIENLVENKSLQDEMLDYLELCLYAAAEHIDDIESIASCFFATRKLAEKSHFLKKLNAGIKPIRDRISMLTNMIKHQQSRIRLFSLDFLHNGTTICLHGFYLEKFKDGTISALPISSMSNKSVISVTSFLWSIITYLFLISEEVTLFLSSIGAVKDTVSFQETGEILLTAVTSLCRLPLYSFDDTHPFNEISCTVDTKENVKSLDSRIYGSFSRRWNRDSPGLLLKGNFSFEGDGTSRVFSSQVVESLNLSHWD